MVRPEPNQCQLAGGLPHPPISLYDKLVTINAGPLEQEFYIRKGLISHCSSYFNAALNGNWKESEEKCVRLKDKSVEAFQTFFSWLYTRRLFEESEEEWMSGEADQLYHTLIDTYIFADNRGIPALKNAVIDILVATFIKKWDLLNQVHVNLAYTNAPRRSPLRKLLADFAGHTGSTGEQFRCYVQHLK